jgi:hypothetical protein
MKSARPSFLGFTFSILFVLFFQEIGFSQTVPVGTPVLEE